MRIKVGAIIIALALLGLVYGSAALTTVAIDITYNAATLKPNKEVNDIGVVRVITLLTRNDVESFELSQALSMKPNGVTGDAQTFYFEIDTTGISAGNAINGILTIRVL